MVRLVFTADFATYVADVVAMKTEEKNGPIEAQEIEDASGRHISGSCVAATMAAGLVELAKEFPWVMSWETMEFPGLK